MANFAFSALPQGRKDMADKDKGPFSLATYENCGGQLKIDGTLKCGYFVTRTPESRCVKEVVAWKARVKRGKFL